MREALAALRRGEHPSQRLSFAELRELAGFPDYEALAARYADDS